GARSRDPAQLLGAREVAVERARPAEAGGDRVRVGRDVVAVQRVADLEAEGVAGAEAAGHGARREHRLPQGDGVPGRGQELDTLLAGVARAVDHAGDATDLALGERERRRPRETEPLERAGALDGDERVL